MLKKIKTNLVNVKKYPFSLLGKVGEVKMMVPPN